MRLYQQLENLLKIRVNSNEDIIPAIKRMSEMGKFDEPKKMAVLVLLLDRLGKMEDEKLLEQSVKENTTNATLEDIATSEELKLPNGSTIDFAQTDEEPLKGVENPPIESNPVETASSETSNPTTPEVETPPSASGDIAATPQEEVIASNDNPVDTTPTVSSFTPENISDPTPPENPVETTS